MNGIDLKSLSGSLHKVDALYNEEPAKSIENIKEKLGEKGLEIILEYYDLGFDFNKIYRYLPLEAFEGFTFDELCKLHHSSAISMHHSVKENFENNPQFRLIDKISNSMWRWSGQGMWNEIVEAYDSIRRFKLCDNPDFELRLDYTTGCNVCGDSEFSMTFIDGVFAYLVYYKQQHVMTIGFSLLNKSRILIQQVQSAQRAGNRYLYKLPSNRLGLVIERFKQYFPLHKLYLVDGDDLVNKTLTSYKKGLTSAQEILYSSKPDISPNILKSRQERCEQYKECINHLNADKDRLISFYNNAGKFKLGKDFVKAHGLSHRVILP